MAFRGKKVYGESKTAGCPFCGGQAFSKNDQGIPVCKNHVNSEFPDMKCKCGDYLDMRFSKFGPFFTCMSCGTMSFDKAISMNRELYGTEVTADVKKVSKSTSSSVSSSSASSSSVSSSKPKTSTSNRFGRKKTEKREPREIVIRSDEVDFI